MVNILHIDTAQPTASVCLAMDGVVMQLEENPFQQEHAAWLHPAIKKIMAATSLSLSDLSGVAVTIGPGSYTGLRIGLSAAKGICFALQLPLISLNTLQVIAHAGRKEADDEDLLFPMIDARRMEVFGAVYDKALNEVTATKAIVMKENIFDDLLSKNKVLFCGNGCQKAKTMITGPGAKFSSSVATAADMTTLSLRNFENKDFADLYYSEPFYAKEFFHANNISKKNCFS